MVNTYYPYMLQELGVDTSNKIISVNNLKLNMSVSKQDVGASSTIAEEK
jgi:hypothetical protein